MNEFYLGYDLPGENGWTFKLLTGPPKTPTVLTNAIEMSARSAILATYFTNCLCLLSNYLYIGRFAVEIFKYQYAHVHGVIEEFDYLSISKCVIITNEKTIKPINMFQVCLN